MEGAGSGGGCSRNLSMNAGSDTNAAALRVLAVDDNLVERKILERLLRNVSSCTVTTAKNGMEALEYLGLEQHHHEQEHHATATTTNPINQVDLIITDYCMPGMTGYQLLKKIKESKVLKKVPVVVMSSENIPTRVNKCLEEGAEMFMVKPLKQSDVNQLIMSRHLLTNKC